MSTMSWYMWYTYENNFKNQTNSGGRRKYQNRPKKQRILGDRWWEQENWKIILKWLPIFVLKFQHDENIKDIFDIEFLSHMRVKIEALKNNNITPQRKKCQSFVQNNTWQLIVECQQMLNLPVPLVTKDASWQKTK